MNWRRIASCFGIHERTLRRGRAELDTLENFQIFRFQSLQNLRLTPFAGERLVKGGLLGKGVYVPPQRVRKRVSILDAIGRAIRRRTAIRRRAYNVAAANFNRF